jgi:hypothetical protein
MNREKYSALLRKQQIERKAAKEAWEEETLRKIKASHSFEEVLKLMREGPRDKESESRKFGIAKLVELATTIREMWLALTETKVDRKKLWGNSCCEYRSQIVEQEVTEFGKKWIALAKAFIEKVETCQEIDTIIRLDEFNYYPYEVRNLLFSKLKQGRLVEKKTASS